MTRMNVQDAMTGEDYVTLEGSNDPVSRLRLLLEICGDDTRAMIQREQCQPLLTALNALIARAEAADRQLADGSGA